VGPLGVDGCGCGRMQVGGCVRKSEWAGVVRKIRRAGNVVVVVVVWWGGGGGGGGRRPPPPQEILQREKQEKKMLGEQHRGDEDCSK
jgi:hypothetical protein